MAARDPDGGEVPAAGFFGRHLLRRRRAAAAGGAHTALADAEPVAVLRYEESGHRQLLSSAVTASSSVLSPLLFLFDLLVSFLVFGCI